MDDARRTDAQRARNDQPRAPAAQLDDSETRYRELFDHVSSGVAVYRAVEGGRDFVFEDFNAAGQQMEGVKKEDVLGRKVTEAFPGVEKMGLLEVFRRVWKTGQHEHHAAAPYQDDRRTGWRENWVYKLPSGSIVAVYDDVTEQKHGERQLKASEAKYRTLFENAGGALFVADAETGELLDCNSEAERLVGRSRSEIVGMHQSKLHPEGEAEKYKEMFARHVAQGRAADYEGEVQRKDGARIPVFIGAHVVEMDGREVIMGLFVDILARKRAEQQLMNRVAELERFHDAAVGREMRMIELKQEVNDLRQRLGKPPSYDLAFVNEEPISTEGTGDG